MSANNNHRKASCGFGEEAIAFLYGEVESKSRSRIKEHIDQCPACSRETAAFGIVRSSIHEWRDEVFAKIETPEIVLPYQTSSRTIKSSGSISLISRLRQIFSQTPVFGTAAAAFAGLAICAGIVLAIMFYPNAHEVAEAPPNQEPAKAGPQIAEPNTESPENRAPIVSRVENTRETPADIAGNQRNNETRVSPGNDAGSPKSPVNAPGVKNKSNSPVRKNLKPDDATLAKDDKSKSVKEDTSANIEQLILPNISVEEEESIRLADLFDEVGSGK